MSEVVKEFEEKILPHILRKWERERIVRFAEHLLGDERQEELATLQAKYLEAVQLLKEARDVMGEERNRGLNMIVDNWLTRLEEIEKGEGRNAK